MDTCLVCTYLLQIGQEGPQGDSNLGLCFFAVDKRTIINSSRLEKEAKRELKHDDCSIRHAKQPGAAWLGDAAGTALQGV